MDLANDCQSIPDIRYTLHNLCHRSERSTPDKRTFPVSVTSSADFLISLCSSSLSRNSDVQPSGPSPRYIEELVIRENVSAAMVALEGIRCYSRGSCMCGNHREPEDDGIREYSGRFRRQLRNPQMSVMVCRCDLNPIGMKVHVANQVGELKPMVVFLRVGLPENQMATIATAVGSHHSSV